MAADEIAARLFWARYQGPNLGYIQEMYERYATDPETVEAGFRELFDRWGEPPGAEALTVPAAERAAAQAVPAAKPDARSLKKLVDAGKLAWNIRVYGHLAARVDPLGLNDKPDTRLLEADTFGLTREDLSALPASLVWEDAPESVKNGWEAIVRLKEIYTGSIAFEFGHVHEEDERIWLNRQAESGLAGKPLDTKEKLALLRRLVEVEQFEAFLHRTFVGQKRFSIEGTDMLVPMLDEIVREMAHDGAKDILMGMAHRGRLNVLAHVLGKPYGKIFSEFAHAPNKDLVPSEGSMGINYGWTGDVKYHLGAHRSVKTGETVETRVTLANNPSHLEYVNPVVEGFTRAAQDDRTQPGYPKPDFGSAGAVLMHGDAAFAGEGIVAETLNFNSLTGYQNGGTIHIIVNNRVGFTTDSRDSRSTFYASDLAKGFEIPIVHVSADDPEACIAAVRLACEFRQRFRKDFVIDLIGYRRYGHNETDDPETTQPAMYRKLRNHPIPSELYAERLKSKGLSSDDQFARIREEVLGKLQAAWDEVKQNEKAARKTEQVSLRPMAEDTTAVPLEDLRAINRELLTWPEGFAVYPKLERILKRRSGALEEGGRVDWGHAETLAFAAILADGRPIRLSGQDSERGTFAHRNLVLHDPETGDRFCPLHRLPQAKAAFGVYNSPLSEASVLGFEYGYNVFSPETLVLWEAQYGDFANAAQVIIDQFLAAGRVKWSQKSSLVLLLPHGYEGQGPEHSSARLERFLQLAAEDNFTVANLTSAAQYFHLLRKQAAGLDSEEARPLVIMAPKSLIRNPRASSAPEEFSDGGFRPVVEQRGLGSVPEKVERLLLCSGKVAVDLETALEESEEDKSWLHIARVEQLYPFPKGEIERIIARFPNLREVIWVQEEPQNMGAWNYMEPRIKARAPKDAVVRFIGRPKRSSPASGFQEIHNYEQQRILSVALNKSTLGAIKEGGGIIGGR
ncbi:2-oxoglutarate dehydrogenase E1 component [Paenibacillus aurantius]|uniref:2-oxoglutarate dehydrogenase E1 component n=1 Tax=Paenibacillus aurantius TaxID=2918900 RepID=A0AA96RHG9_9BACL|nr:2-oxoglutarate dehydrogenase E1 component [Paenibacillus aurantius]WNQ13348.1 2-oxoglutarate dehydrogenase E1 component [Paenibacillus aurantius]